MCAPSQGAMLPYGLKVPSPYFPFGPSGSLTQAHLSALDFQRSQLNDYNVRVQLGLRNYPNSIGLSPFHAYISDPYTQAYFYKHDQRARFVQEEPKPSHSYIGLIGMAILNSKEKKLVLSDIYQWILDNYPYFRTRGPGWRNSIRHNLSLNDCFIKAGRSANGKGHYWAVHPANVEDFERGDFRRRRAQRKVRRHMGLSVPDDEDSPTPSPTQAWSSHDIVQSSDRGHLDTLTPSDEPALRSNFTRSESDHTVFCHHTPAYGHVQLQSQKPSRKRLFDMASLLAPDDDKEDIKHDDQSYHNERISKEKIHGFNFHSIHTDTKSQEKKFESAVENHANDESYPYEDVNVDINSPSSGSGREIHNDSEDDGENDEIQVTSEDDSPPHAKNVQYNAGEEQSGSDTNRSSPRNNSLSENNICTEKEDTLLSRWPSSPYRSESKSENALDLSSSNLPETENNADRLNNKSQHHSRFGLSSSGKGCNYLQLHQAGQSDHGLIKMEADLENLNGYSSFKPLNNPCTASLLKATKKVCEREKPYEADDSLTKLIYNERCRYREEMSLENIAELDHNQRTSNKFQCFRPELHGARRHSSQEHTDSNPEALSGGPDEVEHRKMGYTSEVPVSEAVRISPNDYIDWVEMSKSALVKDRLSAFSALGIRNYSIYSPLHLRTFPLSTHRLLPKAIPGRAGVPSPLTTASTSPSSPLSLPKGMDIDFSKSGYKVPSNICSTTPVDGASK